MHGCAETRRSFWRKSLICSAFFPPLFWQVRPQGGTLPQRRVWDREERAEGSLYLQHSPGAHYPDNITHAQTALCRVFLLIELLNDVESFKTNSVLCVWWLKDMDFPHCGLLWEEGSSQRVERVWWILRWVTRNSNYKPTYFTLVPMFIWLHDKLGNYNNKKRHLFFVRTHEMVSFLYASLTWTTAVSARMTLTLSALIHPLSIPGCVNVLLYILNPAWIN